MTSKTSSPTDDAPMPRLFDALVTHQYDDVVGGVQINVADALLAIATAINRLASSNERNVARTEQLLEQFAAHVSDESGGHA